MSINSVLKISGSIPSKQDIPIYYDLYSPSVTPGSALPVVLFVHGFKGFKDWGAFPDACDELARAGFAVVTFNLSLNSWFILLAISLCLRESLFKGGRIRCEAPK